MLIKSKEQLEEAVLKYGMLPFFSNGIKGFSVEEMTTPSLLFGGNEYEGCWEWKGPVTRKRTTAYGKFFNRKAGFISLELFPHFLNVRRNMYEVKRYSLDEMLLEIIEINDKISSTELRRAIIGGEKDRRGADDLLSIDGVAGEFKKPSRHSLEGPLQRLQMGGRICISDFTYKMTKSGERYGWGVAEYSTPESVFGPVVKMPSVTPQESLDLMVEKICRSFRQATSKQVEKLLCK